MSATIGANDIKLSVFGKGYEDERADSGVGVESSEKSFTRVDWAIFDETGDYCWTAGNGQVKKWETETWTEVGQSIIPNHSGLMLCRPSNVPNNYGLAIVGYKDIYLFDPTDDTLIAFNPTSDNLSMSSAVDCILIDDKIWIVSLLYGNTNPAVMSFDVNDLSYTRTTLGNVGASGFVNNDTIFAFYGKEWFYQTSRGYGFTKSGGTVWSTTEFDNNDDVSPYGMTANGKVILPTRIHGAWRFGVYNGLSAPKVKPPKPIKTFGKFTDTLSMVYQYGAQYSAQYNIGRTKACVLTTCGLLYTDFNDVTVLSTSLHRPVAMNDKWLVCANGQNPNWNGYIYRIG